MQALVLFGNRQNLAYNTTPSVRVRGIALTNKVAFEFRHASWFEDVEALGFLRSKNWDALMHFALPEPSLERAETARAEG